MFRTICLHPVTSWQLNYGLAHETVSIVPSTRAVNSFFHSCKRKHLRVSTLVCLNYHPLLLCFLIFACICLNIVNFFFFKFLLLLLLLLHVSMCVCMYVCYLSLALTLCMTDLGIWWTPASSTQVQKGKVSPMYRFNRFSFHSKPLWVWFFLCKSPQCMVPNHEPDIITNTAVPITFCKI